MDKPVQGVALLADVQAVTSQAVPVPAVAVAADTAVPFTPMTALGVPAPSGTILSADGRSYIDPNRLNSTLCQYSCDCSICCAACCCPCCVYGAIKTALDTEHLVQDPCCGSCNKHCCCFALSPPPFAPHVLAGIATHVMSGADIGRMVVPYFGFILSSRARGQLRRKYNIPEDRCSDCCCHFWCNPCSLCQDFKELEMRMPLH